MQPNNDNFEPIGLPGLYVMILDDEGYMKNTGYIAGIFERFALFQYFSALTGSPTTIEAIPLDRLLDPQKAKLFQHKEVAELHYERESRRLEARYEKQQANKKRQAVRCV
jgi:hypothetical protein